jgi:hypothetical protein
VSQIDGLFPPGNEALLLQIQQTLCQQAVIPAVDSVVAGEEKRSDGVTDLIQTCLQLIDSADLQTSDDFQEFQFGLGNILVCNKLSNSVLAEPLTEGQSALCNAILSS